MANDQNAVYDDFREQLVRNPAGWYETNLPWKANHPDLSTNEAASRRRLTTLGEKSKAGWKLRTVRRKNS